MPELVIVIHHRSLTCETFEPCSPIIWAISVAVVTWFVRVFTSEKGGAGTNANVLLVAYGKTKDGEYRRSDEVRLDNKGDNFESGQEDKFKIEMAEIGKPYKIRISHDNSGALAAWHLDRVSYLNFTFVFFGQILCGISC